MSGRKRGPKASIQGSKPEPPPFIARIRQQLVENEDAERRIRSEKRRREGGIHSTGDEEDDPRVVKLNEDDLTEEEYKRMKLALETQYKLEEDSRSKAGPVELDIDKMIESRQGTTSQGNRSPPRRKESGPSGSHSRTSKRGDSDKGARPSLNKKTLNYDDESSSSGDGDD